MLKPVLTGWMVVVLASTVAGAATKTTHKTAQETKTVTKQESKTVVKEDLKPVVKSDAEWQKTLTADQFRVLRKKGTEIAFTGAYWDNHENGIYRCAGCGLTLFSSKTKYESGTGWPSFTAPIDPSHVKIATDNDLGMQRDEVQCARCGGHLGHVFDDGPPPTGERYCLNSASLEFVEQGQALPKKTRSDRARP